MVLTKLFVRYNDYFKDEAIFEKYTNTSFPLKIIMTLID